MKKIKENNVNVYLINTGMDKYGKRFDLNFTRQCIKNAIKGNTKDKSKEVYDILEGLL